MKHLLPTLVLGGVAVAAVAFAPSTAKADSYAYPCGVTYQPTGYGDHGSVTVSYYSGVACSGSYIGYRRYCSENANSGACAASWYHYGAEALAALYQRLVAATEAGQRVYELLYYCNVDGSGGYNCGRTVSFYAD